MDQKLVEMFNPSTNISNSQQQYTPQNLYFNGFTVDDKGEIRVQVNNVEPQYTYELLLGGNPFASAGPIDANDYIH